MKDALDPLVRLEGITKAYPGVVANDAIDLDLRAGEVHTVLGENGAGKTTLMGILYGLHRADAGRIRISGEETVIASPRDALRLGIGYVQQHFSLIPTLTVSQNLVLALRGATTRVSVRGASVRARELEERFAIGVDPGAVVENLSVGQQQRAELLKALARETRILILDEPGSVLTPQETSELNAILRRLAGTGVAIFLISHKLEEVLRVSDRITVLRRGRVVGTVPAQGATRDSLAALMIGELDAVPREAQRARSTKTSAGPYVEVDDVWIPSDRGGYGVAGASFSVARGEILGIAGVEGSGQVELTEAIAGVRPVARGSIRVGGRLIAAGNVRAAQRAGVGHVPADRRTSGVVQTLSIAEALVLPTVDEAPFSRYGFLRPDAVDRHARTLMERFDIRAPGPDVTVSSLSGGNQQKVVLARELSRDPEVLVCCYPTRGLDFAGTEAVQLEILAMRERGAAVLCASVDIDELLALADRIVVLAHGRVTGELQRGEATAQRLGLLMTGSATA